MTVNRKQIGTILVVIGVVDYGLSLMGVDLTGWIVGSTLSEFTPAVFGVVGVILLMTSKTSEAREEIASNLNENEVLLKDGLATLKHSTFKKETGALILTNQRLIFEGDVPIEIPVQNISSVKGSVGTMSITQKDGTETKYEIGMITLKTWIEVVSETINSNENSTAKEEDDHSGV